MTDISILIILSGMTVAIAGAGYCIFIVCKVVYYGFYFTFYPGKE